MLSKIKKLFGVKEKVRYHCDFCFKEMDEDTMVMEIRGDIIHATKYCVEEHWNNLRFQSNGAQAKKLKYVLAERIKQRLER